MRRFPLCLLEWQLSVFGLYIGGGSSPCFHGCCPVSCSSRPWIGGLRGVPLGGRLIIGFVGNQELLVTAGFFGERFTWLRWDGIIIDPGPARFRSAVQAGLAAEAQPLAVVCTHWHEEHIGNAATIALQYAIPVIAAPLTC